MLQNKSVKINVKVILCHFIYEMLVLKNIRESVYVHKHTLTGAFAAHTQCMEVY